jgi:hypothetical protein
MTAVRPTAPKHGVMIGFCVRKHATQGAIFVQVQNGYELNELHDVFVPNPINNQVLTWDNIDKRWEAKTVADSSATNELQTLSVATNTATLSNSGGSVTIAGAGINTVGTAGTTITVTGTEVDGSVSNELQTLSTGTNTLTLSNGGGTVTVDTDPASDVTGSGANRQVAFWTGAQTQSGSNNLWWDNANSRLGIRTSAPTETFQIGGGTANDEVSIRSQTNNGFYYGAYNDNAAIAINRKIGTGVFLNSNLPMCEIGFLTSSNASRIVFKTYNQNAFYDNNNSLLIDHNKNVGIALGSSATASARLHVVGSGSTSTTWTAQFHNSAGNNNALMIRDDGRIGIGSTTLNSKLTVNGEGTTSGTVGLRINNNNGVSLLQVLDNGDLRFGNLGSLSPRLYTIDTLGNQTPDGHLVFFNARITNQNLSEFALYNYGGTNLNGTTGTQSTFAIRQSFLPTSGSAIYNAFRINTTINQTGTSSGISRGLFISPILTLAADWRSIEWNNNTGFGLYGVGTATNYLNGNLGIKTTSPTDLIDINGANGYSQLRLRTAYTPTGTADANGNTGDVAWDDNYIYIKTAAGWKRSALSTF